jgi:hypothetical protein
MEMATRIAPARMESFLENTRMLLRLEIRTGEAVRQAMRLTRLP